MTTTDQTGHTTVVERDHETPPEAETAAHAGGAEGAHGAGGGQDIHLPPESLWPLALAFAITIASFGLVTNWPFRCRGS